MANDTEKTDGLSEYLGDIDIATLLRGLTNTNQHRNSIADLPRGTYSVNAFFDFEGGKKFLRLELEHDPAE